MRRVWRLEGDVPDKVLNLMQAATGNYWRGTKRCETWVLMFGCKSVLLIKKPSTPHHCISVSHWVCNQFGKIVGLLVCTNCQLEQHITDKSNEEQ